MGSSDEGLLKFIRHYQHSLDKYTENRNDVKLLHCLGKLSHLPVRVVHLEKTGVGRTVNNLRKLGGEVGDSSKQLVNKWKKMVAGEHLQGEMEDDDEEEEEDDEHEEGYHTQDLSESGSDKEEKEDVAINGSSSSHKISDNYNLGDRHRHGENNISSSKTNRDVSLKHLEKHKHKNDKDNGHSSSSSKKHKSYKKEVEDSSDSEDGRGHKRRKIEASSSEDEENSRFKKKVSSQKTENGIQTEELEKKVRTSEHKSKHDSRKELKRKHENHSEDNRSNSKSKRGKSEHASRYNSEERHKSGSSKKSHDSFSDYGDQSKEQIRDRKSHDKEDKHKSNINAEKTSKRTDSSKREESSKRESKKHDDGNKNKEHKLEKKKEKTSSSNSKSKEKSSKHGDTNKDLDKQEHKKSQVSKSKNPDVAIPTSGIDSYSGASFAEALGMCEPSSSKMPIKKKSIISEKSKQTDSKPDNEMPKLCKELDVGCVDLNLSNLLPPITPNYRPLGNIINNNVQLKKPMTDYEALSSIISSKNQRTKVYSGNKVGCGKVPSLFEMCIRILQDNIDALEFTGGVPYIILKPILDKATPNQLFLLEHHNPYLIEDTDDLWRLHCQREFRNEKPEEMESWREMYMRCLDEREAKLKALTANIKQAQDKSLPMRTTKLAYVDDVAKPPRNIARKQAKNGITFDKKPTMTPSARIATLATSGEAGKISVPNPGARAAERINNQAAKAKKAPLMAKTLSLLKNRFRR